MCRRLWIRGGSYLLCDTFHQPKSLNRRVEQWTCIMIISWSCDIKCCSCSHWTFCQSFHWEDDFEGFRPYTTLTTKSKFRVVSENKAYAFNLRFLWFSTTRLIASQDLVRIYLSFCLCTYTAYVPKSVSICTCNCKQMLCYAGMLNHANIICLGDAQ
jgi:hypothetical protein